MDALDDYRSSDDDDYVPGVDADDGFEQSTAPHASSKGTKRKRAAAGIELLAPKRVPMNAKAAKKKGPPRIGAAVLSDDDDLTQPPHDDAATGEETKEDKAQQRLSVQRKDERKEIDWHTTASDNGNGTVDEKEDEQATAETRTDQTDTPPTSSATRTPQTTTISPAPPSTLSSSPSPVTSSSSAAQPPSSAQSSTAQSSASTKGGDLASILAQFNKKPATAKPATKKVINPWELPAKPKSITQTSASSTNPAAPATPVTTASANFPTASSTPPPPPSTPAALSTEQVVVTDITSYAGETLHITKTLIRGSAEELAHRASAANNLSTLLSSLTSQRAISTLEKSRLDWSVSKQEEGDEDELRRFVGSKDGLVDRMAFLARAERREWEKVKEVRDAGKKQTMTASTEGMDED